MKEDTMVTVSDNGSLVEVEDILQSKSLYGQQKV